MPTVEEFTDPFVRNYTPPPPAGEGVCEVCHSWTPTLSDGSRAALCSSCRRTTGAVSHPIRVVVPISLVEVRGSQFYASLSGYKDSPDAEAGGRFALRLGALLARFLRDHGDHVRAAAGRDWDRMTIVPSSSGRAGPLAGVIRKARAHRTLFRILLEATGDVTLDHREASDVGYRVTEDVRGARVLLIDDTFTTGARIQSAASALTLAGAEVVAAVALGRVVRPDFTTEAQELSGPAARDPVRLQCLLPRVVAHGLWRRPTFRRSEFAS